MNCPSCKTANHPGALRCVKCGTELDALLGRSLLGGQYLITRRIARGGFGVVYEAEQPSVGGRAAIKVLQGHLSLKPEIVARFQREATAARKLRHPSAVKIYNLWQSEDGAHWIAMEFLEGETVEARLQRVPFSKEEALDVLGPVCEVLHEAHQKGIVHRDLNTKNVMLLRGDDGEVMTKVIDFGIADAPSTAELEDSRLIMGTPSFMAPEQFRGLRHADPRTDIYATGMIAYRMLSGRFPFEGSTTDAMVWMSRHHNEAPIPLTQFLPGEEALSRVVLKALAKKPEDRHQSAQEFKRALFEVIRPGSSVPPSQQVIVSQPAEPLAKRLEAVIPTLAKESESPAPAKDTDPFLGVELGARYIPMRRLAEGAWGSVYQANDTVRGQKVALKVLHRLGPLPEGAQLPPPEGLPAFRLRHPKLSPVFGLGQSPEGILWVAEELIEGRDERSLFAELRRVGSLSVARFLPFFRELCEVLGRAHEQGVFHSALSPRALLIQTKGGGLSLEKIFDFEVSSVLEAAKVLRARTSFGEPAYAAPEMYREGPRDARADLYALGVIAYQCLAGHLPWTPSSDDPQGWMLAHCEQNPQPLDKVPAPLAAALLQALEKNPADRYDSARAMLEAVESASPIVPARVVSVSNAIEPVVETRSLRSGDASAQHPSPKASLPVQADSGERAAQAVGVSGAGGVVSSSAGLGSSPRVGTSGAGLVISSSNMGAEQAQKEGIAETLPPQAARDIFRQAVPQESWRSGPGLSAELLRDDASGGDLIPRKKPSRAPFVAALVFAMLALGLAAWALTSSPKARCGDGSVQSGEVCDDGNTQNGDGCSASCQKQERCGDKVLDPGEVCDDGNFKNGDGCRADCKGKELCGDGLFDPVRGEECDDGNLSDDDACRNDCHARRCGNGVVERPVEECELGDPDCGPDCLKNPPPKCGNKELDEGEACDDGNQDNTDGCLRTCKASKCGDGFVHAGKEQCDDGDQDNADACTNACETARCGDKLVWSGVEQCDDGDKTNTDGCTTTCEAARCGDGFVRAGKEQCDDGNQDNTDACLNSCSPAKCGDGFVQAGVESCDDGNQDNSDGCPSTCRNAACGDGVVQAGVEQCDDGNQDNADACLLTCQRARCGDGVVHAGAESCDDGNQDDADACRNDCTPARCGDGVVQVGSEECDDGNQSDTDTCTSQCKAARCGDGVVQAGKEQCDDGNPSDADDCTAACKVAKCGDGFLHSGVERCDDGNSDNNDGCTSACDIARCGDGVVQTGKEQCDDGNLSDEDGCRNNCTINNAEGGECGDGAIDVGEECDTTDTCEGAAVCNDRCRCE
jgi:cysteine-rich repeat protein